MISVFVVVFDERGLKGALGFLSEKGSNAINGKGRATRNERW